MADDLRDSMVTQRNLQVEEQSPTLQAIDAQEQEAVQAKRNDASIKMQASDWWDMTPEQSAAADGASPEKEVELTTSDDHLPYLSDIQGDYDLVGQFTDDGANGTPRQKGEYAQKYVQPNKRTVRGVDLANGTKHWNLGDSNIEGVDHHINKGVEILRESTNSATDGPSTDAIRGVAHIAQSIQLEGGDFNELKRSAEAINISDERLKLGWNAAARAGIQQQAEVAFVSPVEEPEVASLPAEPIQDLNTSDLVNERLWIESAKFIWDKENASEFTGSPEELSEWALNEMSNFNWRIAGAPGVNGSSMAYYATQAALNGEEYAKNLLSLIEMYDRVNTDLGIVKRSVGALLTDPTTYAGLGFGKVGVHIASRVAKNRMKQFLIKAGTIGAGEGAMFAGGENLARQSVAVDAGAQEEISAGEVAASAGIGAGAGAVLGPVVGSALSPYAMKMYRRGGQRLMQNARAGGGRSVLTAQTGAVGDLEGFIPMAGQADRISTRLPTAVAATEDAMADNLVVGIPSMAADPKSFSKNIEFIKGYDNYRPVTRALSDEQVANRFKDHIKQNLRWLHDQMKPEVRARAKLWYDGARKQTEKWSSDFGLEERQVAAVIASLSPQKDWFMNMSLAERMMDIWTNQSSHVLDDKMSSRGDSIFPVGGKTAASKANRKIYETIQGKQLSELNTDMERAMWVRLYDEAHNPRHHKVMTPDGAMVGYATKKDGERKGTGWGSLAEIGKAVSVLRDGSLENISSQMGGQHKVRNFYSNIIAPYSDKGEVTIDTHAVAAALVKPLSGKGYEVDQNFGSSSVKGRPGGASSSITGSKGTYGIYADAYREAAEELGILPRELQSIVWEEVRTLFTDTWKNDSANLERVNKVWQDYRKGKITQSKAQEKIYEIAEGTSDPVWHGRSVGGDEGVQGSTYKEELSGDGVPRGGSGGADGGGAVSNTERGKVVSLDSGGEDAAIDAVGDSAFSADVSRHLENIADMPEYSFVIAGDLESRLEQGGSYGPNQMIAFASDLIALDVAGGEVKPASIRRAVEIITKAMAQKRESFSAMEASFLMDEIARNDGKDFVSRRLKQKDYEKVYAYLDELRETPE